MNSLKETKLNFPLNKLEKIFEEIEIMQENCQNEIPFELNNINRFGNTYNNRNRILLRNNTFYNKNPYGNTGNNNDNKKIKIFNQYKIKNNKN